MKSEKVNNRIRTRIIKWTSSEWRGTADDPVKIHQENSALETYIFAFT